VAYVQECHQCQTSNTFSKGGSELHPLPVPTQPFEYVGMDLVGKLPRTKNENECICVLTCHLTKWPHAYAIKNKEAITIHNVMVDYICQYGCPISVLTDQGREFCNLLNENLCQSLAIKHHVTSPYHPQTNGLTERYNQTLCHCLVKYVNSKQTDWDLFINRSLFAYRTSRQKSPVLFGLREKGETTLRA
jgi:IS30 family transposase